MTETKNRLHIPLLFDKVTIFPLVTFRVLFGALVLYSTVRFWDNGWIEDFYLTPTHFFPYFGLDWILPYSEWFVYGLFITMALSAIGIMLGAYYRLSSVLFFLSFTYVELIDKTTYLNHYYFVSLMAFILMFLPAHRWLSIDTLRRPHLKSTTIHRWSILALQMQIVVLYFFAGVAKLNPDWLFNAQPMTLWLDSKSHLPVIGEFLSMDSTAYLFSWAGMLFDLSIGFILFSKKLRPYGYAAVVVFHLMTGWLFPIGVFPWVMMGLTLVFFSGDWHKALWKRFLFLKPTEHQNHGDHTVTIIKGTSRHTPALRTAVLFSFSIYFLVQFLLPMRHLAHDGELFWNESGYRFSWRVMLMEKTGSLEYIVKDAKTGKKSIISLDEYFTAYQQRQMVTQPDMIWQGAQIIAEEFRSRHLDVEIYAQSKVCLNGSRNRTFIQPDLDLAAINYDTGHHWVEPRDE